MKKTWILAIFLTLLTGFFTFWALIQMNSNTMGSTKLELEDGSVLMLDVSHPVNEKGRHRSVHVRATVTNEGTKPITYNNGCGNGLEITWSGSLKSYGSGITNMCMAVIKEEILEPGESIETTQELHSPLRSKGTSTVKATFNRETVTVDWPHE